MRLLFITQKLHGQDSFGVLWANAFAQRGYDVTVLCLEWQPEEMRKVLPDNVQPRFRVLSMGKEAGVGKIGQVLRFWKHVRNTRADRVFIHMSPIWGLLGAPVWILRRTPTYLWYTHYKMQMGLRLLGWYGKRLFCATPQSLPQYEGNPKKVVVGHGIDMRLWPKRENHCEHPEKLLGVYRLSRSKRLEICIEAMKILPERFTWDIYGIEAEAEYVREMKALVNKRGLERRITFHGTVPMQKLPEIYARHRFILNMASETIDKTMLEAMTCGCYPVTTARNAEAIGIRPRSVGIPGNFAPADDSPEALAQFILDHEKKDVISAEDMHGIVSSWHSLETLITRMDHFISLGQ